MMFWNDDKLRRFIKESYSIENESISNEKLEEHVFYLEDFLNEKLTEESVLKLHLRIYDKEDGGIYRTKQVYIGDHIPPPPEVVPLKMKAYCDKLGFMNSREAHNKFEDIHPFVDFNGRIGRSIWLHIVIREGYKFNISFLHQYYYQTLSNSNIRQDNFLDLNKHN